MTIDPRLSAIEQRLAAIENHLGLTETAKPVGQDAPAPTGGDDTATLIDWLAGLEPGSVVDLQGVTYRCDRSVTLDGLRDLTIRDLTLDVAADTTELDHQDRSTRRHLWARNCTGIRFEGLTVTGGNTTNDDGQPIDQTGQASYRADREFEHAIAVEDCTDVVIDGLTVDAVRGDGAYLRRVTNTTLTNFRISRNGRQGIASIAGSDVLISHGTIVHSRRSGIDIEPNSTAEIVDGVEIGHVTIQSRLIPITSGGPGIVRNVHVHDIESTSDSVPVLSLVPHSGGRRDDWTVERWTHHTDSGSPLPIISGVNVANLIVRDCIFPAAPARDMTGVGILNAGPVTLERVKFPGAARLAEIEPAADHTLTVIDCEPAA